MYGKTPNEAEPLNLDEYSLHVLEVCTSSSKRINPLFPKETLKASLEVVAMQYNTKST